jgi:hypothetical protein
MTRSTAILLALSLSALPAYPAAVENLCPAATASATITELTVKESVIESKGTWQAGGGAPGVVLEYRFDSDRLQSENQAGPAGTWHITQDLAGYGCGKITLRVTAVPYVQEGVSQVHCLNRSTFVKQTFEISCAPVAEIVDCRWECDGGTGGKTPGCTGTCTGSARRGKLSYLPSWGVNGDAWQSAAQSGEGPFTQAVTCMPGQKISFKVRDRDGRGLWSNVAELGCGKTE